MNAAFCKSKDHLPKIVQVAGQPVHRVADHRLTIANVANKLLQLRTMEVLARSFVYEPLVENNTLKLTQYLLIERADAQVSDELTSSALSFRHFRPYGSGHLVSH